MDEEAFRAAFMTMFNNLTPEARQRLLNTLPGAPSESATEETAMPSAKPPSESSEELQPDKEEKGETPLDTPVQGSTPCVTPHKAPPPSIQHPPPPPPKKQPTQPSPSPPAKSNFPPARPNDHDLAMPVNGPQSPRHEPLGQRPVGGPWTSYDGSWWHNFYSHGGEPPANGHPP